MSLYIIVGELNETQKNRFEWKIPAYNFVNYNSYSYSSPSFTFANTTLYLLANPPTLNRDWLSLYLVLENSQNFDVDVNISFSIKFWGDTMIGTKTITIKSIFSSYGFREFMDGPSFRRGASESSKYLDESLTIVCDLKIGLKEKPNIPPAGKAYNLEKKSVVVIEEHQGACEISSSNNKEHVKLIGIHKNIFISVRLKLFIVLFIQKKHKYCMGA